MKEEDFPYVSGQRVPESGDYYSNVLPKVSVIFKTGMFFPKEMNMSVRWRKAKK